MLMITARYIEPASTLKQAVVKLEAKETSVAEVKVLTEVEETNTSKMSPISNPK